MTETPHTRAQLDTLLATNHNRELSAVKLLDFVASVMPDTGYFKRTIDGNGAPTDGVTGAGTSEPGAFYIDLTAGSAYVNKGTKVSPVWQAGGGSTDFTAIASDVKPSVDDTYSLGSDSKRWKEGHFGSVTISYLSGLSSTHPADSDWELLRLNSADNVEYGRLTGGDQPDHIFYDKIRMVGDDNDPDISHAHVVLDVTGRDDTNNFKIQLADSFFTVDWFNFVCSVAGNFYPAGDNGASLGIAGQTWGGVFATLPTTTDPDVKGEMFTCTGAELAGLLGAGAKYVLMSKHA